MSKEKIFEREIKSSFRFLVDKLGFIEVSPKKSLSSYGKSFCYALKLFYVEVFYVSRDSEVGVNIGRITQDGEEEFSFHMYLGIVNPTLYYKLGYSIANKDAHVIELLDIYSNALKKYCIKIRNNEDLTFKQMQNVIKSGSGLCPAYYAQAGATKIVSKFV